MTPDTACRRIAEAIVNGSRHLPVPILRGASHPIDRGYLIDDMTRILRSHTAIPKMVTLLEKIRDMDDDSRHAAQGRGEIARRIDRFFTALQGKPTETGG